MAGRSSSTQRYADAVYASIPESVCSTADVGRPGFCTATVADEVFRHSDGSTGVFVAEGAFVQIVVSQLSESAAREEFIELHRRTAKWMADHPDCVSYEVFEGSRGAIADRIVWRSKAGALRGNEEYARTDIAAGMQRIIASYTNFFGVPVQL